LLSSGPFCADDLGYPRCFFAFFTSREKLLFKAFFAVNPSFLSVHITKVIRAEWIRRLRKENS